MINDDKWIYKKDEKGIPTVAAMVGFDLLNLAGIAGGSPRTGHPELSWRLGRRGQGHRIPYRICHRRADTLRMPSPETVPWCPWFSRRRFCCGIGMNLAKILAKGRLSLFAFRGVDISEQIVRIEMEVKQQPNVDALRPGSFAGSL